MTRFFLLLNLLLLLAIPAHGQGISDTIRAEKIFPKNIIGTYGGDRNYYKFKTNKKCTLKFVAPRSLVYHGEWEIKNDTLICTFKRVNSIDQGENTKLKDSPMTEKFVFNKGILYKVLAENERIYLVAVPKTK